MRARPRGARGAAGDRRPIVVDGARELVPLLARELREGGDAVGGARGRQRRRRGRARLDRRRRTRRALRAASLARVPIVGVTEGESVPYVLDTDLVGRAPGRGASGRARSPTALARRARRSDGAGLAARLPVLREPRSSTS